MLTAISKLITVEEFSEAMGLKLYQGYDAIRNLPPGVVVRIGRRVRLAEGPLQAWLAAGGNLSRSQA